VILQRWHAQQYYFKKCNPPPLVSITSLQKCMFGAGIVQDANMQNRGNGASQGRLKE
jgi:hypothetical protein